MILLFSPGPRDPACHQGSGIGTASTGAFRRISRITTILDVLKNARKRKIIEELQKQIEKLVRDQFECRQARRQTELTRFEEQIKRLRDAIEKREKARDVIIDRRVKELLGQEDDLKF